MVLFSKMKLCFCKRGSVFIVTAASVERACHSISTRGNRCRLKRKKLLRILDWKLSRNQKKGSSFFLGKWTCYFYKQAPCLWEKLFNFRFIKPLKIYVNYYDYNFHKVMITMVHSQEKGSVLLLPNQSINQLEFNSLSQSIALFIVCFSLFV